MGSVSKWVWVIGLLVGLSGCGLDSIKSERASVEEASKAIFLKVIDSAKIDAATLSARGQVVNPEYRFNWFGGTGIYSAGSIQAVGVNIEGEATGAGVGSVQGQDPDLREKIYEIQSRSDLSESQKAKLISDVTKSVFKVGEPKVDEPVDPTTSQPVEETHNPVDG